MAEDVLTEKKPHRRASPTAVTRARISRALRGRPHSAERRRKMSLARRAFLRLMKEAAE